MSLGRYIIVASDQNKWQENAVTKALKKEEALGWWHWYPHTWLVKDPLERGTPWLRELVKTAAPGMRFFVFEADDGWSGYSAKEHFEWMYGSWGPSSRS